MFGAALAWITAEPRFTPVTVTFALFVPDVKLTVAGTCAMLVSVELRAMVIPAAGAGADKFNVRVAVFGPAMVKLDAVKLMESPTCSG